MFSFTYPRACFIYFFFSPGDGKLLRHGAALVAPARGPPGGLRLFDPVPPAQRPHAVPAARGRLGCGESCRRADGGGPPARGGLPAAGSPRNPPGPVHLQHRFGCSQEVAVKWGGVGSCVGIVWNTATVCSIKRSMEVVERRTEM